MFYFFFFFKQKTAYDMRISDWSSDVCSSDLRTALQETQTALVLYTQGKLRQRELAQAADSARRAAELARRQYTAGALSLLEVLDAERSVYAVEQIGRAACRERGGKYG